MRRRDFALFLGGAAAWPLRAHAQPPAVPVIGFLHTASPEAYADQVAAFRRGLSEGGYVEGRTVAIEYRWAHNDNTRLPELAADLVNCRVAVIVTPVGTAAALAAKAATQDIPIVFSAGTDPVKAGLVASLNRPGGNVTGIGALTSELAAKRLGILHELLPRAARFALLVNPNNPVAAETMIKDAQAGAAVIGRPLDIVTAGSHRDIEPAFAMLVEKRCDGLLVGADPMFNTRRAQLITLSVRHLLPTMYAVRDFAAAGGLMSYGPDNADRFRQVGIYTARILKGEKPADLPVMQATKFEFVINLPTARMLGLEMPPMLLARADEVIE